MLIAWTKIIHIAALMVWCAGLLMLPSLYVRRNTLRGTDLHDLQRLTRLLFIKITSPAAFVAIIAGTLLIFLRDVFTLWMVLKLVAVGMLALLHVRDGYILLHLFESGGRYARWRQVVATIATLIAIGAILLLVLAKPHIDAASLQTPMFRPGALQSLLETMIPIP
jgi:protoporphyrinogen IX oxidase